jgi:hypothetical protein
MYIELLHGRDDPKEEMEDFGFKGPIIGPFSFMHVSYLHLIRLSKLDFNNGRYYTLDLAEDMLKVGDSYYGDWVFFERLREKDKERVVSFEEAVKNGWLEEL